MSRDPFDQMKSRNPVPGDQVPGAPMSVAERIMAGRVRSAWPGWAIGVATAAMVGVLGFGALWFLGGGSGDGVADGGDTTTVPESTSMTLTDGTTTLPPSATFDAVVYLFMDTTGESWTDGPFLAPVVQTVSDADPVAGTLRALIDAEIAPSVPALSTAVPEGTVASIIGVTGGVVTIDLSSDFVSGGGTFSMTGRLAQVVFTLTRLDGIDGVRFLVEGVPTTVFGGEGIIVNDPATRDDFAGALPAILIEEPAYGGTATNPLIATGTANVFEATVSYTLTDGDGLIIAEGFTTATCGTGCRGDWEITIPYEVDAPQLGSLIVWEASARDGSQTNVREHPVWLTPASTPVTTTSLPGAACSGWEASTDLIPQPDLPAAVAAKRTAIWDAALECDLAQLARLLPDAFTYSFGGGDDPIGYWTAREDDGEPVLYLLAELLNRPFGVQVAGDITYYVWPSVFAEDWASVGEKERDALRPLYNDEDFAGWDAFGGYIGYRIGITADGEWVYFVAGD